MHKKNTTAERCNKMVSIGYHPPKRRIGYRPYDIVGKKRNPPVDGADLYRVADLLNCKITVSLNGVDAQLLGGPNSVTLFVHCCCQNCGKRDEGTMTLKEFYKHANGYEEDDLQVILEDVEARENNMSLHEVVLRDIPKWNELVDTTVWIYRLPQGYLQGEWLEATVLRVDSSTGMVEVRYSLDGTCDSIIPRINFVSTIKPHDDDDDGSSDSGSVGSRAGQPGVASIWSCDAREHLRCSCTTPASDVYTLDVERCSEALNALAASASAPDMSTDGSRLDVAQHVIDCIRCIRPELPADVVFTCDRTLGNLATGGRDGELSDMASGGHSGLLAVAEYIGKHVCSSSLSAALMNVYELLRERS